MLSVFCCFGVFFSFEEFVSCLKFWVSVICYLFKLSKRLKLKFLHTTNIDGTSRCVKFSENRMLFCIAHGLYCLLGRRVAPKGMRCFREEGA